jgi:hypothetical protein
MTEMSRILGCYATRWCGELGSVRQPIHARGHRVAASLAIAGLFLAALCAAACSSQPGSSQASVGSCTQFGESAIRQHVTVTTLPPACRGLTAAQVDAAVGTALRSAGSGVRGKALRRARIVAASHYLAHMFVPVPGPNGGSSLPAASSPGAAGWLSKTTWGLLALGSWLATIALGLGLMARRGLRRRARRPAGRRRRPPALNLAHLGLAGVSLLAWVVYLATAATGAAWAAAGLLPLVAGLGMALLFLAYAAVPAAPDDPAQGRRVPVLIVGAHVVFATATILFAVLAAIGTG